MNHGAEKREPLATVVVDVVKGYVVALKDYDLSVFGHSESGKLSAEDEVEKINTAANAWASDLEKRERKEALEEAKDIAENHFDGAPDAGKEIKIVGRIIEEIKERMEG